MFYIRYNRHIVCFLVFYGVYGLRFCAGWLKVLLCCTVCCVFVLYSLRAMFIYLCENDGNTKEVVRMKCEYTSEPCYMSSMKICNEMAELCKRRKLLKKGMTQRQIDDAFCATHPFVSQKYRVTYKEGE